MDKTLQISSLHFYSILFERVILTEFQGQEIHVYNPLHSLYLLRTLNISKRTTTHAILLII